MKNKICNQVAGGMGLKCLACNEQTEPPKNYPYPLEDYIKFLDLFTALHTLKGCNDKKTEQ